MGFPTKVQLIQRKESEQWYINFPSALAQAMEFEKGEEVEWIIADKAHLILSLQHAPPNPESVKKTTSYYNSSMRCCPKTTKLTLQPAESNDSHSICCVDSCGYS